MVAKGSPPKLFLRDLGGGLVLRRSTPADCEKLAEFNSRMHGGKEPDMGVAAWTRDLFEGTHPTFDPADFLVVENTADGKIISSSNLISQTWEYDGISFGVGRPELISTDPEYRRRGLVRAQMEVLHAWSMERGEPVQVITGIPNYYRQFGYEMAAAQDCGRYVHYKQYLPLEPEKEEPYTLRPAAVSDIPVLIASYEACEKRSALTCRRSAADWEYEITGKNPQNVDRVEPLIIADANHQPVGSLGIKSVLWTDGLAVAYYALLPGISYLMVTPSVLRFLWAAGQQRVAAGKICRRLILLFGEQHPAYKAIEERVTTPIPRYAYYMRVPDLPGFLRLIAPVLEKRLSESACAGHSGNLRISFYRDGIRLTFEKGRIAEINPYAPVDWQDGDAFFPDLTFLRLLFQADSLEQLRAAYTDCLVNTEGRALLEAMFPRSPSGVWVVS